MAYTLLANAVLVVHFTVVAFIVLTLPCIFIGAFLGWRWVRLRWLRILHLASIGFVAAQSWLGVLCPLTDLEMWLRQRGATATYSGSFIEHWLQAVLYWEFPAWVFIVAYSLFALLIVLAWYLVPPNRKGESCT